MGLFVCDQVCLKDKTIEEKKRTKSTPTMQIALQQLPVACP
jgi:hypothetical protein